MEQAFDLGESVEVENHHLGQIQLTPLDNQPYYFASNLSAGVLYDDNYTAEIITCSKSEAEDITANINIQSFEEGDLTQILFCLANLPTDYHAELVYLKITFNGIAAAPYFSNPFLLTNDDVEYTSRIDYLDKDRNIPFVQGISTSSEFFQSARLKFYYKDYVDQTDLETYYQISTSQNVNTRASKKFLSKWITKPFNAFTFSRLSSAFYNGSCYINQIRNYPIEGFEYNEREELSNISESVFITDPDEGDFLIILPVYTNEVLIPFRVNSSSFVNSQYYINQSQIPV